MFEKDGYSRASQIAKKMGVNKCTVWRWNTQKDFPKSIKWTEGITVWSNNELNEWLESRKNQS